ncbi:MAG: TonB C-terminal domain-containing protein [Nitrospiraceae bacterium]|nr:MAG: TonB C-terminal domain-containing protein [Nitrospiraceae bacterium]
MKEPSLQKTTAFSALIHITVFFLSLLIIKQNNRIIMPSPYTVQLVSPENVIKRSRPPAAPAQTRTVSKKVFKSKVSKPVLTKKPSLKVSKPVLTKKPSLQVSRKKRQEKSIDEAIHELRKKKHSQKKDVQILALSHQINARRSGKTGSTPVPGRSTEGTAAKSGLFDGYYHKITAEIWQEWIYPDIEHNNLETIVLVKILRDGTIHVQRVEKKSSNILFDRSALKALAKASPVSPPPYEMEIGIRFYP